MNKVFGVILKIISVFFVLALIAQLNKIIEIIFLILAVLLGEGNAQDLVYGLSSIIYYIFFAILIIFLWKQGSKLMRKNKKAT